ncbi:hypothetical protein PVAP13_3KG383554 [Panicum virgatum]|uniref:Uncharacterized protein n=1 Tax=Panicum virgatum TaxID=38727 RepID=A0A8T0V774_PANVG|nr:hypothetical protein PVAP13_3KG383554 [Panicum virgatum]
MAPGVHGTGGVWRRYAPHVLLTLVQLCFALMSFITKAAMDLELNPYVYVNLVHLTGVLSQEVPSLFFANGVDVHAWRDSVCRVCGVPAAQAPRLADRFRPQVLVHRVLRNFLQWIHILRSAVVHRD